MVIDQLNLIKKQSETMLRNKVSGSAAKLRAETSLVKQASRLTGRMNREMKHAEYAMIHAERSGKHRVEPETVAEKSRPIKPAPDGYVRRSAVQPIRVPKDYHRQIVRRILTGALGVLCILAAVWLLLKSGLLAY